MSLQMRNPLAGEVDQTGVAAGFVPGAKMVAKTDVWLVAEGMLAAQGNNATRECEAVIESRRKQGDHAGAEKWTLVLASVRELLESD